MFKNGMIKKINESNAIRISNIWKKNLKTWIYVCFFSYFYKNKVLIHFMVHVIWDSMYFESLLLF